MKPITWTVARYPSGEWTTGGSPTSPDYEGCEIIVVQAVDRDSAKREAQKIRRRKGYIPNILSAAPVA